jgi:hypothetical protein
MNAFWASGGSHLLSSDTDSGLRSFSRAPAFAAHAAVPTERVLMLGDRTTTRPPPPRYRQTHHVRHRLARSAHPSALVLGQVQSHNDERVDVPGRPASALLARAFHLSQGATDR